MDFILVFMSFFQGMDESWPGNLDLYVYSIQGHSIQDSLRDLLSISYLSPAKSMFVFHKFNPHFFYIVSNLVFFFVFFLL